MKIRFNYYLKIKNIMGKEFDEFEINEPDSFKNIFINKIEQEKLKKIDLLEILVIRNGENIKDLDEKIHDDSIFSICPKIYGG